MINRPRQRDIADRAQVSQTTVSLVLNGKSRQYGIGEATERRVQAAIAELGYVPNVTAQALRSGRNGLIAVHTFEPMFPTQHDHYYYEFMVGIEQRAMASGQDLVMLTSVHQNGSDVSIYHGGSNRLRIADGAVILGFQEQNEELEELARQRFPFVFIGRRPRAAELMPYVVPDYAAGMAKIAKLLADRGHRKIAYVGRPTRILARAERLDGFARAAERHQLGLVPPVLMASTEISANAVVCWRQQQVTAVLVETHRQAEAVGRAARDAGIDIPVDLGVVCLDSLGYAASRAWTHLQVPRRELGARAVDVLLGLLAGKHRRTYSEELTCPVERGQTLLPVSAMSDPAGR